MIGPGHEPPASPTATQAESESDAVWRRVLVFHIGSLGDTVLAIPALAALRDHVGPTATITLLHNAGASERVAPTSILPEGLVDEVLRFTTPIRSDGSSGQLPASGHAVTRSVRRLLVGARRGLDTVALSVRLRRRRFDAVVNLALADRSARSLRRDRAFYRSVGIRTLVGLEPDVPGEPEAEVRLARLRRAGIPAQLGPGPWISPPQQAVRAAQRWRTEVGLAPDTPIVTLAPGTLMEAKRWPLDRWSEIASRLRRDRGVEVVVVGGPADHDDAARIVAGSGGGLSAAGALDPMGSAALLSTARLHVGVDTGTTHLAAAVGTPVVALFSERAPIAQWAPMGRDHRIVHHEVPCAGCEAVVCPVVGHPCMREITVDEVWAQIEAALGADEGATGVVTEFTAGSVLRG